MAMSGIPWWDRDIGGFFNGDIESDYFRELIVRWMAVQVYFVQVMRHTRHKKQSERPGRRLAPGILAEAGGYNELLELWRRSV